jgi:hypothetical protein
MGNMTTPKPLIDIIWTYQEMMEWMSMQLMGAVDVHMVGFFGLEVGQIKADFLHIPPPQI